MGTDPVTLYASWRGWPSSNFIERVYMPINPPLGHYQPVDHAVARFRTEAAPETHIFQVRHHFEQGELMIDRRKLFRPQDGDKTLGGGGR